MKGCGSLNKTTSIFIRGVPYTSVNFCVRDGLWS